MINLFKYLTTPAISDDAAKLLHDDVGCELFYCLIEKRNEFKRTDSEKTKKEIEIISKKILNDFNLTVK